MAAILSVVVPAYNEEPTLRAVVQRLLGVPHLREIVIVDDCSIDRTHEIAQSLAFENPSIVRVIQHRKNGGKTEALKTGFAATVGSIVIVQDADLEYDPGDIELVIDPVVRGHADVVFGSRFQASRPAGSRYLSNYLANKMLTVLSNWFTGLNLTDVETCYKAFSGDIIRRLIITSRGFGFEIEVAAKIAKLNCAIQEVPISYSGRTHAQGKKIGTKDGIAALWYLVKYNLFTSLDESFEHASHLRRFISERS